MPSLRAPWQVQLGIVQTTGGITTQPSFELGSGGVGLGLNVFGLPVLDVPDFTEYPEVKLQDVTDNRPDLSTLYPSALAGEFAPVNRSVVLEMECFPSALALFGWLLFQNGSVQTGGGPYRQVFGRYSSDACEVWGALLRSNTRIGSANDNDVALGCICRTLRLSAVEGGVWMLAVELLIASVVEDHAWTITQANQMDYQTAESVMPFSDSSLTVSGASIPMLGAEITFTNSAQPKRWSSPDPYRWVLGHLTGSLKVRIPWEGDGTYSIPYWKSRIGQGSLVAANPQPVLTLKSGSALGSGRILSSYKEVRATALNDSEVVGDLEFVMAAPSFEIYENTNRGIL